jgi:hypothetical protein
VQTDETTPYTHIELINGNWYRIELYVYKEDLFWIVQEDWLINSASTLHLANFASPTAYKPRTIDLRTSPSSEEDKQETAFPDPDKLEPTITSPGGFIAQELD